MTDSTALVELEKRLAEATPYTPEVISRLTQSWFAREGGGVILLTTDPKATGDDSSISGIGFGLADFIAMLREFDRLRALQSQSKREAGDV